MTQSDSPKRIAVLGSAFDPPTLGHLDVIKQCLVRFDEVWLVPAYCHAFDKKMGEYTDRVNLLNAFVSDIHLPHVEVYACEDKIKSDGKVYSIDLMTYLGARYTTPKDTLSLVIGPDNEEVFDRFKDANKLKSHYAPFVAEERLSIRSSQVRAAIKLKQDISHFLTPSVLSYIVSHQLYT